MPIWNVDNIVSNLAVGSVNNKVNRLFFFDSKLKFSLDTNFINKLTWKITYGYICNYYKL